MRANTNQTVIQKIENGRSLRPRCILDLARALDVDPAWLMFGSNPTEELPEEALELAKAWNRLPEPARSRIRQDIFRHLGRR